MASAPPDHNENHHVVIVLSGSKIRGSAKRRLAVYKKYMQAVRALAGKHGARVVAKEIHLKQHVIDKRKKDMRKEARRGGK